MRPRIVALGDSLTSGHGIGAAAAFPAALQRRIDVEGFDYAVVNAGASRETSAQAAARFARAVEGDVRIVIIALGANDGLRGVAVAELQRNIGRIIEAAQARRIAVLLCAMEALPIYGWDYTTAFHNAYVELAQRYKVRLVPFIMMKVFNNPALLLPDRVHPNAAGAQVIADHIWSHLQPLLTRVKVAR